MIIDKVEKGLKALSGLNYKNVLILLLICVIGLGTFWTYKKIDTLQFSIEEALTPRDKYFEEFGIDELSDDLLIRDILTETRLKLKANEVSMWGYHNGVNVGPFPFKKVSLLDESVGSGDARLAKKYQSLPLNLFIPLTVDLWELNGKAMPLTIEEAQEKYPNVYYEMLQNGYGYQYIYPIRIQDQASPIGLFIVFLNPRKTNALLVDTLAKEEFEDYAFQQAKRVELIFNAQYTRLKSRQTDTNE